MLRRQPATRHDFDLQPIPDDLVWISWTRTFSLEEYRLLKLGFVPDASDHWLAFFEDDTFYIYWRSSGEFHISFRLDTINGVYQATNSQMKSNHMFVQKMGKERLEDYCNHLTDELLRWIKLTEYPATSGHWKTIPMPEQKVKLDIELLVSAERFEEIRWGYIPRAMEDHWFYYMEDDWFYIHRSWTGYCFFQIKFVREGTGYRAIEVWVNRDTEQYRNTDDKDREWLWRFLTE